MNLNKLMKQAQKMQEQMAKTQAELEEKTVEVTAGGGKVTVVANGAGDVLSIKIAREVVDPEDVEILEDMILSGVQQAIAKGKEMAGSEMSKLTGGMNLPGLGGMGMPLPSRGGNCRAGRELTKTFAAPAPVRKSAKGAESAQSSSGSLREAGVDA
jgi:DNA-binding YbaB/EbfC family protein